MRNRIGAIRKVITALGGESEIVYYADGPGSTGYGPRQGTIYKINNQSDGLTADLRAEAVKLLADIPGVERAWVTRSDTKTLFTNGYQTKHTYVRGGHIKVHFTHQAQK